jgi:saccharopine dehydrogenase-like NADP-dependent oxidoreductase
MRKVLILGAGLVSRPIVHYLLDENIPVTVADIDEKKAKEVISGYDQGNALQFDLNDEDLLSELILKNDIIVSLVPYIFHPKIARICIKHHKHLVTTSYVSQDMRSLDRDAKEAGIILLNEIGLDPGIDHMAAKKIIDEVHGEGGFVEEFYSFCGALPAPESADNPFKYKFSWSPRGVLLASKNSARYKLNGNIIEVPSWALFTDVRQLNFDDMGGFEVYPNRDSIPYADLYEIQEASTVLRGTIRFPGWCNILTDFKKLDLFSEEKMDLRGRSFSDMLALLAGLTSSDDIRRKLSDFLKIPVNSLTIEALDWLGLTDHQDAGISSTSPFELLAKIMIEKMMLGNKDRDMVLMLHAFKVRFPGNKEEIIRSKMVAYGSLKTDTAIARTVAYPAAIGVKMILNEEIKSRGVIIPVIPEIYNPVLQRLAGYDIKMSEEYGLTNCPVY